MNNNPIQPETLQRSGMPAEMPYWEYIVNDFLETGCFLEQSQRQFLLDQLRFDVTCVEHIEVHPAFTIDQKLITVLGDAAIQDVWIYNPSRHKLRKHTLRKTA